MVSNTLRILGVMLVGMSATAAVAQRPEIERADLGIDGRYKVGCWTPLKLQLVGGEKSLNVIAQVTTPDGEGLMTAISTPPFNLAAGEAKVVELLVRIGRLDAPVGVRLNPAEGGRSVAQRTFDTRRALDQGGVTPGEPATTRLVVEVGPAQLGVAAAEVTKANDQWYTQSLIARLADLGQLPRNWLAYEAVDTVLVSTSDRDAWARMRPDDPRVRALTEWVEMGGRVILFCGGNSPEVLAPGGPLAALAPGRYREMATVDDLTRLESYVAGNVPIPGGKPQQLTVPWLDEVRGDVELSLGGEANQLPLVVRARHGLGQVVWVALDIDAPPLRIWKDREKLVEKLLALSNDEVAADTEDYYYDAQRDISTGLAERLDQELENSGIQTPPFLAIAGLVVLYILIIGPGDYLFVKRVLKRMEWTWVTFPAIVVLTCLAAYWYADYLKGDDLRINQIEILDVDATTGLTRGTMWTHVFSPSPDRYTLTLAAQAPDGSTAEVEESAVAWFGRPGGGLGGLNSEAGMSLAPPAYFWTPDRSILARTPIEIWSTKTFTTRWRANSPTTTTTIFADLTRTSTGLIVGELTNQAGVDLIDCKLIYGDWAWRLGELPVGETTTIEPAGAASGKRAVRKLRTTFQGDYDYKPGAGGYYEHQHLFSQLSLSGQAELMMFFEALGGRRQTYQWNRYQHFVDLSRALDSESAMLVGYCHAPRSELVRVAPDNNTNEMQSMRGEKDLYVVIYRFVLPVKTEADGG